MATPPCNFDFGQAREAARPEFELALPFYVSEPNALRYSRARPAKGLRG